MATGPACIASPAASLGVQVFPAAGQDAARQSQSQAQATEAQMNAFRNGFSACLEGKQYIAKF